MASSISVDEPPPCDWGQFFEVADARACSQGPFLQDRHECEHDGGKTYNRPRFSDSECEQ